MPSGSLSENDDSRDRSTSARQALIFVLLGPVLGVLIVLTMMMVATGGPSDAYGYPVVFFFSLIVCVIIEPVDDALARIVPIHLRVPLTATAGGCVAVGIVLAVFGHLSRGRFMPPSRMLFLIAAVAALNTGACSLLAYAFRRRKA